MFNHRKLGINYNLVALLDVLCLECKFDIVSPDMPGLNYILMPPSIWRVPSVMKHLKLTTNFKSMKEAGNEEQYGKKSL